jgi:hypothetical protein
MAEYITKIRTESGDKQIDYNALANLPKSDSTLSQSGKFADAKTTGDKIKKINNDLDGIDVGIQDINTELQNLNDGLAQHVHPEATQEIAGFMSAADKEKLDGIREYELPTADSQTIGGVTTTSEVTSADGLIACPIIDGVPYYENSLESLGITIDAETINKLGDVEEDVAEKTKTVQITLNKDGWTNNSNVWHYNANNVTGVVDDSIIIVSSAPNSIKLYAKLGVRCISQGNQTLTFEADKDPSSSDDIYVNVAILG